MYINATTSTSTESAQCRNDACLLLSNITDDFIKRFRGYICVEQVLLKGQENVIILTKVECRSN